MANDVFGLKGQVIDGRYRIDEAIGEGGFGVVYRGFHLSFEHAVAIKCLKVPGHFTSEGRETFMRRFQEEGRILSKLSHHPAIVRVFDLGVLRARGEGVPYLVLEWLEGRPLSELMAERRASGAGGLEEGEATALVRPVIEALASVHEEGIAHRDVKPENIFLCERGKGSPVKLLDFGIAKAMQEGERVTRVASRTSSNFSAFSPRHGAPEQFRSKAYGATGPWTDVHAIGLVLAELSSANEAIVGEEFGDMLLSAIEPARPTPRRLGASVSDAFEALVARCVALDPRQRFLDANALLEELERVVPRPSVSSARRSSSLPRLTPAPAPPPAPSVARVPAPDLAPPEPDKTSAAAPLSHDEPARRDAPDASEETSLAARGELEDAPVVPKRRRASGGVLALGATAVGAVTLWLAVGGARSGPAAPTTTSDGGATAATFVAASASASASVSRAIASAALDDSTALDGLSDVDVERATVTLGKIVESGGQVSELREAFKAMLPRFRRCYARGRSHDASMRGVLTLTVKVGPHGEVLSTASARGSGLSDEVVKCVDARVAASSFAEPRGGETTVTVPLTFAPRAEAPTSAAASAPSPAPAAGPAPAAAPGTRPSTQVERSPLLQRW